MAEAGNKVGETVTWAAVFAPAITDPAIVDRLNRGQPDPRPARSQRGGSEDGHDAHDHVAVRTTGLRGIRDHPLGAPGRAGRHSEEVVTSMGAQRLGGRRIVITGAASGIGRSTAQLFAAERAPNRPAYAASKVGVLNLTRALAAELAPSVRANCVCPGLVDTPMAEGVQGNVGNYALKRLAQPQEIASAIMFLTSAESSYVTGAALAVDGGRSFH